MFTAQQGDPPPQRPSSPEGPKTRPVSALSIQRANTWLGGGRDLYWESLQKRPKSSHVPGWKEGLPESMKRPKSAVANRTLNRYRNFWFYTYCENLQTSDIWQDFFSYPKIWTVRFYYHTVMGPKDADRIANSADPEQMAASGAVWSGSTLFAQICLSKYLGSLR